MPMYNFIEYRDNNSKTSRIWWQYSRDEPAVDGNGEIVDVTADNATTSSFKLKKK